MTVVAMQRVEPRDQVVVTGIGVTSPIGIGREAFWSSLIEGRSGVGPITLFDPGGLPVKFAAEVRDFEAKKFVKPRKSIKIMGREIQLGVAAALLAVEDAALDTDEIDSERLGVIYGSEMIYGDASEMAQLYRLSMSSGKFDISDFGDKLSSEMYPLWMLKYLPNMAACHAGIAINARGPNNTLVQLETGSLSAVIEATSMIWRGAVDMMVVGGIGSRMSLSPFIFHGDTDLSHRHDQPQRASRPFDADRDGMVNGEGAAAMILERRDHAEARGAEILATVASYGRAHRGAAKNSLGHTIDVTIGQALAAAGITAREIGHVNAHGLGTKDHDPLEAQAIHRILGDTPVTAPKSYFGNLGAGSGAVEMAASVLAIHEGKVPATLNYETPDDECPVKVIRDQPLSCDKRSAIVLNQDVAGQAVAVLLTAP